MEHDTNMEISVISENKMHDNTSINDTIMNTNSTDIQLKRKTNNSIIRRRNPRYVGDLCREDFTSDGTWRLFKEHLVNTRTKIKALNQKIVYLNRKVDRLRKKALMDALSSDNEDSGNNLETTHQRKIPKLKNFAEVIVPRWKEEEFKSHFRMSRNIFEFVLSLIAPKLKRHHPGLEMISAEKQFLITIWRMASPDTYKSICERFNVSRSTAVSTTRRVTKALADLAPMFIKWPVKNSVQEVWAGFEAISAFPKVIGAIDGIYINIPSPRVNPEDYVDKKGHYSVQLQGICDHKFRFTHCYIGHAGSDQRIFLLSEIQDALGKPEKFPDDCYLIGDAAYKLHDNLMIPYCDNGHLTKRQKNYNYCHSLARIAIVKAFGLLKGRFQSLLHYLPMARTDLIDHFILACCVLHNICISHNDDFDILPLKDEIDNDISLKIDNTQAGMIKRDLICEKLSIKLKI
ncbi:putative nuclease HARBI1 isoform X2 [Monomorium pharaonis]|nr:putative nuclease HARBI1 isoform X2 [Monomorium pharaonis]